MAFINCLNKLLHIIIPKQVSSGEPNGDVATDNQENTKIAKETSEEPTTASTAEVVVKANGDVKPVKENGSVAATKNGQMKSACITSAC